MMNLKKSLFAICLVFLFVVIGTQTANAAGMMDNFLPDETDKKQEGTVNLEYNEYPLSNYGMDTHLEEESTADFFLGGLDKTVQKQLDSGMTILNSTLWQINKLFSSLVGMLVSAAFNFDVITGFAGDVSKAIREIVGFDSGGLSQNGLWAYFLPAIICLVGIWAAYVGVMKRATSQALGGILTSIFTIALALGFFTNADKILTVTNDGISEVQNDILSFTLSAALPGQFSENEGIATMRNQIFNLMIKYPYLLLEYGTVNEDEIESQWKKSGSRIDTILKTKPLTQERQDVIKYEVKELNNENMKPQSLNDRFVILVLSLIMNATMGTILILLSCSLIGYQIMLLVYAVFTSITFLIGVIPSFAPTARKNLMKLLHAFYMKIALTLLISIYFAISKMIYNNMNPQEGYALLFLMQIIIAVLVWVKRHELLNVITTPFRAANINNTIGQNIREYKQAYFKGREYLGKATKPLRTPAKSFEDRTLNKLKARPGVGVVDPMRHPSYTRERQTENTNSENQKQSQPVKQQPVKPDIKNAIIEREKPAAPSLKDGKNIEKFSVKDRHANNTKPVNLAERKTGTKKGE